MAHICHVSPSEVDRLRVADFFSLIAGIEAYLKAREKSANAD